ncbi:MAG: hypothetical protein K2U26_03845, partial [Cyclobacteriaceae bacterium]|nr:hypothetical protein [Cyclobacteriaceae bacterium]
MNPLFTRLLALLFLIMSLPSLAQLKVQNLRVENLQNPMGLDEKQPRFSWQLASDKRNVLQTAYEITVRGGKNVLWNTGKINSDQSVYVAY